MMCQQGDSANNSNDNSSKGNSNKNNQYVLLRLFFLDDSTRTLVVTVDWSSCWGDGTMEKHHKGGGKANG